MVVANAALLGSARARADRLPEVLPEHRLALTPGDTVYRVVEGEDFQGVGDFQQTGWRVGRWETDAYQTCTFGGVHFSHKRFLLGAVDGRVTEVFRTVDIPRAATYRVWAKYEAP